MEINYTSSNEILEKLIARLPDKIGECKINIIPIVEQNKLLTCNQNKSTQFFDALIRKDQTKILPYLKKLEKLVDKINLDAAQDIMPFSILRYNLNYFPKLNLCWAQRIRYQLAISESDAAGNSLINSIEDYLTRLNSSILISGKGRFDNLKIEGEGDSFKLAKEILIPSALASRYCFKYMELKFGSRDTYSDHCYYTVHFSRNLCASPEKITLFIDTKRDSEHSDKLKEQIDKEMAELGASFINQK